MCPSIQLHVTWNITLYSGILYLNVGLVYMYIRKIAKNITFITAADIDNKKRDEYLECEKQGLILHKLSYNRQRMKSKSTLIQFITTTQNIQCVMRWKRQIYDERGNLNDNDQICIVHFHLATTEKILSKFT